MHRKGREDNGLRKQQRKKSQTGNLVNLSHYSTSTCHVYFPTAFSLLLCESSRKSWELSYSTDIYRALLDDGLWSDAVTTYTRSWCRTMGLPTSCKETSSEVLGDLCLLVDQRVGGWDTGVSIQFLVFALCSLQPGMLSLGHITYVKILALPLWSQVTCSWTGSPNFISPGFLTSKTGVECLASSFSA